MESHDRAVIRRTRVDECPFLDQAEIANSGAVLLATLVYISVTAYAIQDPDKDPARQKRVLNALRTAGLPD